MWDPGFNYVPERRQLENLNKVCISVNSIMSILSSKIALGCQLMKVIKKMVIT